MSAERTAVRSKYDAFVELAGDADRGPFTYAVAKFTYVISDGKLALTDPEPLDHDFRDPDLEPRLQPGTDYWPEKPGTDFVVRGAAHAPDGKPIDLMQVVARIGSIEKRITVFGRRAVVWNDAEKPKIEAPEPFETIPLTYENAYGGLDWRFPVENVEDPVMQFRLTTDHPAMYPRNPWGKGYLVMPEPVEGMEMPNLEDPEDLLTAERLIVGDPKLWYRQPLPWCFDWVNAAAFPRRVLFAEGVDPWFPGPDGEHLIEVRRGFFPSGYRAVMSEIDAASQGLHPLFHQEASLGLFLKEPPLAAAVELEGMHPGRPSLSFLLPEALPQFDFEIEGELQSAAPRIHGVVCFPEEEKVTITYAADVDLPRAFLPGVHKYIPVAVSINGDELIRYEAPPTMHEKIQEAKAKQKESQA